MPVLVLCLFSNRYNRRKFMAQPQADAEEVVKAIAAETNTPPETVSKLYSDTLARYQADGRILDYMPLLAAKSVREALRRSSSH
jgi:murein L,D-transpeptidase YafK